jgi:hypothetical protein
MRYIPGLTGTAVAGPLGAFVSVLRADGGVS